MHTANFFFQGTFFLLFILFIYFGDRGGAGERGNGEEGVFTELLASHCKIQNQKIFREK